MKISKSSSFFMIACFDGVVDRVEKYKRHVKE